MLRLSRWEPDRIIGERCIGEFPVDWRSALADALADYNVPTGKVIAEFERLCLDPCYVDERRR